MSKKHASLGSRLADIGSTIADLFQAPAVSNQSVMDQLSAQRETGSMKPDAAGKSTKQAWAEGIGAPKDPLSWSMKAGSDGPSLARATLSTADGVDQSTGWGVLMSKNAGMSYSQSEVTGRDAEGKATDSRTEGATLGLNGLGLKSSQTRNGNQTSGGFDITRDGEFGVNGGFAQKTADGRTGLTGSGVLRFGPDSTTVGASLGHGPLSAGLNVRSIDDRQVAGYQGGPDPRVSYGLLNGTVMDGMFGVKGGAFEVGASVGTQETSMVEISTTAAEVLGSIDLEALDPIARFRSKVDLQTLDAEGLGKLAKSDEGLFRDLVASGLRARVEGIEDLADVEAEGMPVGESITMRSGDGWNAGLNGKVGVLSASLGLSSQDAEQTVLSRTGENTWQVQVSAMTAEAAKLALEATGLASAEAGQTDTGTTGVTFVVDRGGLEKLRNFQETGLLPGAATLEHQDPEAKRDFADAKRAYEAAEEGSMFRAVLHEELREKAAVLNAGMLNSGEAWSLTDLDSDGLQYTGQVQSDATENFLELKMLPFVSWFGIDRRSIHESWNRKYRQHDQSQNEYGSKHTEDYFFASTERTNLVANPQDQFAYDASGNPEEIELAMYSEQDTNKRQRKSLNALGENGVPDSIRDAWVAGDAEDHDLTRVSLALGERDLETLREASAGNEELWATAGDSVLPFLETVYDAPIDTSSVTEVLGALVEHGLSGGDKWDKAEFRTSAGDALQGVFDGFDLGKVNVNNLDRSTGPMESIALLWTRYRLSRVRGPEDFAALQEEQQSLFLTSYALQAIDNDGDPWNAIGMAVAVKDKDVRNSHIRRLFHVIERRKEDTHAVVDFIGHVQGAKYLDEDEKAQLLSKVDVDLKDNDVDRKAKKINKKDEPTSYVVDQMLGESRGLWLNPSMAWLSNNNEVDWLKSVEASGRAGLMDEVLTELDRRDPEWVVDLVERTRRLEPTRADRLIELLGTSQTYEAYARKEQAPWWEQLQEESG